jgi:uncharacterized delta-60 repeat protein/uncharacterized repeat protein (TIGR01451 family)
MKKPIYILYISIIFLLFSFLNVFQVDSAFVQDDNNGSWNLTFNNNLGIAETNNIIQTYSPGSITVNPGESGYIRTSNITPASSRSWQEVRYEGTVNDSADLSFDILDCSNTPLHSGLTFSGNSRNISSLGLQPNSCIRIQLNLSDTDNLSPTVTNLRVTWEPLPVFLVTLGGSNSVIANDNIVYTLNYSLSYADDQGAVVWMPMPIANAATFDASYGQNLSLEETEFVSASNGGVYTAVAVTVAGKNIPANSVYWNIGNIPAGRTGTLSAQIKTRNGTQNGVVYQASAFVGSNRADSRSSTVKDTIVTSAPNAEIIKSTQGTLRIGNNNYIYSGGSYTETITYNIRIRNIEASRGREVLFDPVIADDLSNIMSNLTTGCGLTDPLDRQARISNISHSGVVDFGTNTIAWNINDLGAGQQQIVSFQVDYSGCAPTLQINNIATISADNLAAINANVIVRTDIDVEPRGIFAKGDKVNGISEIRAGRDDNRERVVIYGETSSYFLRATNGGLVNIGDVLMLDRIPNEVEFVSDTVSGGTTTGVEKFYYVDSSNSFPNGDTPPAFDYTTRASYSNNAADINQWLRTVPSNPGSTTWVLYYLPCVSSPYLPTTDPGVCFQRPSEVIAEVVTRARIPDASQQCLQQSFANIGYFTYNSNTNLADANTLIPLASPGVFRDREMTHLSPALADISVDSSISGPSSINAGASGVYTIEVVNNGNDTVQNLTATINIPQITVNGATSYLDFVSFTGGTNTRNYDAGKVSQILVNLSNLNVGQTRTLTLTLAAPFGVSNNTSFTLSAILDGSDDQNCTPIAATLSQNTLINSRASVEIIKTRNESVIDGGGDIHYQVQFVSTGSAPTSNTFIVDRIPQRTVFQEAYTNGTDLDTLLNDFECTNCQVYFASRTNASLPADNSPQNPFTVNTILSNFSLGREVSPGVWLPPVSMNLNDVAYIAWKLDDSSLASPILATGSNGRVGMMVTNDENAATVDIDPSISGTIITNYATILSSELLQAIGNQILTTILPDPGLDINKTSNPSVIVAGGEFDWYIDYVNDSANPDEIVTITDRLPYGAQALEVFHTWNDYTQQQNPSLPSTEQNITNNSTITTITLNPDGTTEVVIKISPELRGGDLVFQEGGRIRIRTRALNTLPSGTILVNEAEGCYQNSAGAYCLIDYDNVRISNPDLWIRKSVDMTDPIAGETLEYTLIVSNEGAHFAPDVIITDTLPAGLCYSGPVSAIPTTWTVPAPHISVAGDGNCQNNPTTLTWSSANSTVISHPTHGNAYLPGNSEDIYISYNVEVHSSVAPGTTLTNTATIATSLAEDLIYPNNDNREVITPLPDPYIFKYTRPSVVVLPGESFEYVISYGNNSRETAQGVYLIDSLPDYDNDNQADLTILSTVTSRSEVVYYHSNALDNQPTFDPLNPTDNGWNASPTTPTNWIAVAGINTLGEREGPYQLVLIATANDPVTGNNLPAGITLTNTVTIYSSTPDTDMSNNTAQAVNRTPSLDLSVVKSADSEGVFPGLSAGDDITYTITVRNSGTVEACQVYVEDTMPVQLTNIMHNFVSLELTNLAGEPVNATRPDMSPILEPIDTTFTFSGQNYRWELGSSATVPYEEVCMPAGSQATFNIFATVVNNTPNATRLTNTVVVGEDSASIEDTLENNTDDTYTYVYLADVLIQKSGYSCGPDNICGNGDDNPSTLNPGERINYTLSYDNAGDMGAENVVISEMIPLGTCYSVGTVEANQPPSTILTYSNDDGITYSYTPVAGGNGTDCNVTNFQVSFTQGLPSPANFGGEASGFEGVRDNTYPQSNQIKLIREGGGDKDNSLNTGEGYGLNSQVQKTVIQNDGKIVVVGSFSNFNNLITNRIARLNTDGSLDSTFNIGTGPNGVIRDVAMQNDGKLIIVGDFTSYNGTVRNRVARLNTDGSLDFTFNVGNGANNRVNTTVLQSDGKVIIAGSFSNYSGISRNNIARINENGTLDNTFTTNHLPSFMNQIYSIAVDTNGRIYALPQYSAGLMRLNSDGSIDNSFAQGFLNQTGEDYPISITDEGGLIIAGNFTSYNGTTVNRIARLNADGTLDPTFNVSSGANGTVWTTAIQIDGKVIVGGQFTSYNGTSRNYIARINSDGSLDTTFDVVSGFNSTVQTAVIQIDGKVIIGGYFTSYNGASINRIARLNANGTLDPTFNVGSGANSVVRTNTIQSDGKIIIGGNFTTYNGVVINRIARLNTDGSLDATFNVGTGANNWVQSTSIQSDGKIIIGGDFTNYNGTPINRIARLNADGTLDPTFNVGSGANGTVSVIKILDDGKILISGNFLQYNGMGRSRIARLNDNGTLDTSFNPGTGANGSISTIGIQNDNKIVIGGWFNNYNSNARNYIARLNTDGTLDATFLVGAGANSGISTISILSDDKIILGGGFFTSYNGNPTNRIARLNSNGSFDNTFNVGTGANSTVSTTVVQSDGKIIIGGDFTSYNGTSINRIARLNSNGSLDNTFNVGTGANNTVQSIEIQDDGKVIIGGSFTGYNNQPSPYIIRLHGSTEYVPLGTYTTSLTTTGLLAYDNLLLDTTIPDGTDIYYTILDSTCTTAFAGHDNVRVTSDRINVSNIPASNTELCVRFTLMTSDTDISPSLGRWMITYSGTESPSFSFATVVRDSGFIPSSVDNVANISTTTMESNYANNTDNYTMQTLLADLSITKDVNLSSIDADDINLNGATLTYTLNYRNNGPATSLGVVIEDYLPNFQWIATAAVVHTGSAAMNCTATQLSQAPVFPIEGIYCDADGDPDTASTLSLLPGEQGSVTITVSYLNTSTFAMNDILINQACISATTYDPNSADNCDSATTIVGDYANVYAQKTGPSYANLNREVTYTINYGNSGNIEAEDVTISDTLSSDLTFVSVTPANTTPNGIALSCSHDGSATGGIVTCEPVGTAAICTDLGNDNCLPAGESGVLTIVARVNNDTSLLTTPTTIENTVCIATSREQTSISDDCDDHNFPIMAYALSGITGRVFMDKDEDVIFDQGTDIYLSDIEHILVGYDIYGNIHGPSSTNSLYTQAIDLILQELITEGVVLPGTTTPQVSTLNNYLVVEPSISNSQGQYFFNGLNPGVYTVVQRQPQHFISTGSRGGYTSLSSVGLPVKTADDGVGSVETSDPDMVNIIRSIRLNEGDYSMENNFGELGGLVGNFVFMDLDKDGIFNNNDTPIPGAEVTLYDASNYVPPTKSNSYTVTNVGASERLPVLGITQTNSSGQYYFEGLELDDYNVNTAGYQYMLVVTDSELMSGEYENTRGAEAQEYNSQNASGYVLNINTSEIMNLTGDFGFYQAQDAPVVEEVLSQTGSNVLISILAMMATFGIVGRRYLKKNID